MQANFEPRGGLGVYAEGLPLADDTPADLERLAFEFDLKLPY